MKIKNILVAAAVMFTACSDDEQVVEHITGPTDVNVISANITVDDNKYTGDLSWKKRRMALLKFVADEKPDILCLQALNAFQVTYMEQQLTDYVSIDYGAEGNNIGTSAHNTIFISEGKYTVEEEGRFWLCSNPGSMTYPWASKDEAYRIVTWAILKDNKTHQPFMVGTTQFNDGDENVDFAARENSAETIIKQFKLIMEEHGEMPVILTGDMSASYDDNDVRRECLVPLYDWMKSARDDAAVTDDKASNNGFGTPVKRLAPDHIFVKDGTPVEFRTLDGNYGVRYLSDHFPIYCKIKI